MVKIIWSRVSGYCAVVRLPGIYREIELVCFPANSSNSGSYDLDADHCHTILPRDPGFTGRPDAHDCVHEKISGSIKLSSHPKWVNTHLPLKSTSGVLTVPLPSGGGAAPISYEWVSDDGKRKESGDISFGEYFLWYDSDGTLSSLSIFVRCSAKGYKLVNGQWRFDSDSYSSGWRTNQYPIRKLNAGYVPNVYAASLWKRWISEASDIYTDIYWRADQSLSYGDLSRKAAEDVRRLDINSIAYIRDFAALGTLAKSLVGFGGERTWKEAAQSVSSFYLANHYGTQLTIRDTEKIAQAIDLVDATQTTQTVGAVGSVEVALPGHPGRTAVCQRRITAVVDSIDSAQLPVVDSINDAYTNLSKRVARMGYELDMLPTLSNLYDLVPYSFVVDWFVPIGDALEQVETTNYLSTFQVHEVYCSSTTDFTIESEEDVSDTLTRRVSLSYHLYERECRSGLPTPPMRVDFPSGDFTHWVEASALILQSL